MPTSVVAAVGTFYAAFVAPEAIRFETTVPAAHAMVTLAWGEPCEAFEEPFINDCDYDLAGAILQQMYGPLAAPDEAGDEPAGDIVAFDQAPFDPGRQDQRPRRHRAICSFPRVPGGGRPLPAARRPARVRADARPASARPSSATPATTAGPPSTASSSSIRRRPRSSGSLLGVDLPWPNPQGCWDWWGFTGPDYALKSAPQITAITAMIDRLTSEP